MVIEEEKQVELNLEESSELRFKVKVVGMEEAPQYRFICENSNEPIDFMFKGVEEEDDQICISIPAMEGKIKPGTRFNGRLEALVENRRFVPLELSLVFKAPSKVVAESLEVKKSGSKTPNISVQGVKVKAASSLKELYETRKK